MAKMWGMALLGMVLITFAIGGGMLLYGWWLKTRKENREDVKADLEAGDRIIRDMAEEVRRRRQV